MNVLFNTNNSKVVLSKFKTNIDSLTPGNDFETERNNLIRLVVSSMAKTPEAWDENCQISINWIGDNFINRLTGDDKSLNKGGLDDICASCFRFLYEFDISMKGKLSVDFEKARRFVLKNVDNFEGFAKDQIQYAINDMPSAILKQLMSSDAIQSIKDFNTIGEKAERLKSKWDDELEDKEKKVTDLKVALDRHKTAFNFVGLHEGFNDLSVRKKNELNSILWWLCILSIVVIIPLVTELLVIYMHIENIELIKTGLIVSIFPTVSLVVISIYYFRVLLFNYRSVKSQLLQIDLRKTLCRFIQHYASYSQEIKATNSEALSKFENIIFSGIVTDEGKLPSTYDGIEQLVKLVTPIKQ